MGIGAATYDVVSLGPQPPFPHLLPFVAFLCPQLLHSSHTQADMVPRLLMSPKCVQQQPYCVALCPLRSSETVGTTAGDSSS